MNSSIPVFELQGDSYEIGLQLGTLQRERIHAFLEDDLCRLNLIRSKPTSMSELSGELAAYRSVVSSALPASFMELCGLANGADISFEEALLLQLRRELQGYSKTHSSGDCTSFVAGHKAHRVFAQTIDLNGGMAEHLNVLRIRRTDLKTAHDTLLISFTGLLGYLGVNGRGLSVGLNLVLADTWRPAIPGYMAIRHILDSCNSLDEAVTKISRLPLASSRSFTICGEKGHRTVERTPKEFRLLAESVTVHANHFLSDAFAGRDELNPLAASFSRRRQMACEKRLLFMAEHADARTLLDALSEPPVYVRPSLDVRREETVALVAIQPQERRMWVQRSPSDEPLEFNL